MTAEVIFKEDLENIFGKRIWDKEEILVESSIIANEDSQQSTSESNDKVTEEKDSENTAPQDASESDSEINSEDQNSEKKSKE